MEKYSRAKLAFKVWLDRKVSKEEVLDGYYPHADRSMGEYFLLHPGMGKFISSSPKGSLVGLDIGCGTGRAAQEIINAYSHDITGITLTRHPPVSGSVALPKDRVKLGLFHNGSFPEESFDFCIAVGSFDTSDTVDECMPAIHGVLKEGGFLFGVFPTVFNMKSEEVRALYDIGFDRGNVSVVQSIIGNVAFTLKK